MNADIYVNINLNYDYGTQTCCYIMDDCRSGFKTLPPAPLQEQPAIVLYWRELGSLKV
jgi:hypothetical protein